MGGGKEARGGQGGGRGQVLLPKGVAMRLADSYMPAKLTRFSEESASGGKGQAGNTRVDESTSPGRTRGWGGREDSAKKWSTVVSPSDERDCIRGCVCFCLELAPFGGFKWKPKGTPVAPSQRKDPNVQGLIPHSFETIVLCKSRLSPLGF